MEARYKPELCLPEAMHGVAFNRDLALKIAARMRKKAYGLPHFYDDIRKAFPELELYCATLAPAAGGNGAGSDADDAPAGAAPNAVTSGLTSDAEYRTIGAMLAVYWLMRIGIDGERGFSFGVDEELPREVPRRRRIRPTAPSPRSPRRAAPTPPTTRRRSSSARRSRSG